MMQPLASMGNSHSNVNTSLSTSVSLSLFDHRGNELLINTTMNEPIEFIIPRDPNAIHSSIQWEYVSSQNLTNRSFHFHSVDIPQNENLSVSLHLDIHPNNTNVAYWFIYRYDDEPYVNSSDKFNDGWALFCPSSTFASSGNVTYSSFRI